MRRGVVESDMSKIRVTMNISFVVRWSTLGGKKSDFGSDTASRLEDVLT